MYDHAENGLTKVCASALKDALKINNHLQKLNLSCTCRARWWFTRPLCIDDMCGRADNKIFCSGLTTLADALKVNNALEELNLRGTWGTLGVD